MSNLTDKLILALDQGTTSSRAILFDRQYKIVAQAQCEFAQHFPAAGWVEHNPMDIWQTTLDTAKPISVKPPLFGTEKPALQYTMRLSGKIAAQRTIATHSKSRDARRWSAVKPACCSTPTFQRQKLRGCLTMFRAHGTKPTAAS